MRDGKVSIWSKFKNLIYYMLNKEIIKFGLVGVSNTFVDAAVYWLCINILSINYLIAQIVGYTCGIINSFILNKIWTFKKSNTNRKTESQLVRFVTINVISLSITLGALKILVDYKGINEMIAKLLVIVLAQVVNFLGYKLWVFKGTEDKTN